MGKSSPNSPPPRNLGNEISQILGQSGPLNQADAFYSPQQVGLDLSNLNLALQGTPGGTRQETYSSPIQGWRNSQTGAFRTTDPGPAQKAGRRGQSGYDDQQGQWLPGTNYETKTRDVAYSAAPGLLDQLGLTTTRLGGIQNESNTANRSATYNDLRSLNPSQAGLYDSLAADAQAGMNAGERLTPEQINRISGGVRSDWAQRGLGASNPAQLDEALQLFAGGNALGQQRRANAASTAQLGNQLYTTPAMGFSPDSVGAASGFMGYGGQYGQQPNILQQLGGYGSDLFNTNFNSQAAANINKANAQNANISGGTSAAAGIGAALILACWAAREVFGEVRSAECGVRKWELFRRWLFTRASGKFRNWYLANGPTWAERLRANPRMKSIVRRFMESKIEEVQNAL